ncbi:MAG: hypothetical protein AAF202_03075 [Pseudomonadota bacterium]
MKSTICTAFFSLSCLLVALSLNASAHSASPEDSATELPEGVYQVGDELFYQDLAGDEKSLSHCWKHILQTQPWIKAYQIECLNEGAGIGEQKDQLCLNDESEVTGHFQAYIEYVSERNALEEAISEAARSGDQAARWRAARALEQREIHWKLHPSSDAVYGPLQELSRRAGSYDCQEGLQ